LSSESSFSTVDYSSVCVPVTEVLASNCRIIYEKWESLRGGKFAPTWTDIDLPKLLSNIISFIRVIDVSHSPFDLTYRFWGTGLVRALNSERTGKSLTKLPAGQAEQVMTDYKSLIEEKAPQVLIYHTENPKVFAPRYAPSVRLPLSDDGETVNKIIAYANFDADQDMWSEIYEKNLRERY
jgi:hypothetical protein